jgi:hypothetical protein
MVISYYGNEFFRVQFGDIVVAINPASKEILGKTVKFGADIAVLGSLGSELGALDQVRYAGKDPFVIDSPGEYEIKGVVVKGWPAQRSDRASNHSIIYMLELEGMNLCFLSGLSNPAISPGALQELSEVDILFVPIGGGDVLDSASAYKLAVSLEPHLVIPSHYDEKSLKLFLKEAGAEGIKSVDKLTVKKRDLQNKEVEAVVLRAL